MSTRLYLDDRWWREHRPETDWKIYENFWVFLVLVWRHLRLPDPTPIQLDIADALQYGPTRLIIEAFRGVGKSWITSAYVCWLLLRNADTRILVISASKTRADDFSTFTLQLIHEIPILHHLIPRQDQRASKISFDVGPAPPNHAPSVKSVGIFGQLAGSRADVIIPDDIEVPNTSETQGMREKLRERIKEFDAILKPGPTSYIRVLGTPQCEESTYNVMRQRGYSLMVWPARYPAKAAAAKTYGDTLGPAIVKAMEDGTGVPGESTEPTRFSTTDLLHREASWGRSGFALQFMLDTRLADADRYPLKLRDLIVLPFSRKVPEDLVWSGGPEYVLADLESVGLQGDRYHRPAYIGREWVDIEGSIMWVDPSGKGKDETAWAAVQARNGFLFCPEATGMRGGYGAEVMTAIAEAAKLHQVSLILVESNFGGGMFSELLKPYLAKIYPCTVEDRPATVQKERRIIETLEPVMNQHRLVFHPDVIQKDRESTKDYADDERSRYQLFWQMTRITSERGSLGRSPDRLDALAGAVSYYVEQMAVDKQRKIAERELAQREAFYRYVTGHMKLSLDGEAMGRSYLNADQGGSYHGSALDKA